MKRFNVSCYAYNGGTRSNLLTAPWFWVNHTDFNVVQSHYSTKLKSNVPSPNNYSLPIFLSFYCFHKLISIINFPQVEDVLGISTLHTKIWQLENLNRQRTRSSCNGRRQKVITLNKTNSMRLTVDPVAITSVWYVKDSPAALTRVFEVRSAFTISVLRINDMPARWDHMMHKRCSLRFIINVSSTRCTTVMQNLT